MSTNISQGNIKLRLYYWNVRGRIQAVRYMLEDAASKHSNLEYQDDFEIIEKMAEVWPTHKTDENISGPFRNLPVLHINDTHIIAQTLPIAQYVARKFDLYGKPRSPDEDPTIFQGLIEGIVSCAYTDVIMSVFMIIYSQVDFDDATNPYARLAKKVVDDFKTLERLLSNSSTPYFYDQNEPTIADYFVFYAFTLAKDLHSGLVPTESESQALNKLEQLLRARPALAKYFNESRLPDRFSGSPTEAEYRTKLASKTN